MPAGDAASLHVSTLVAMAMMEAAEVALPRCARSPSWIKLAVVEDGLTAAEELPPPTTTSTATPPPVPQVTWVTGEMLGAPISRSLAEVRSAELLVRRGARPVTGVSWAVSEWFSISMGTHSSPLPGPLERIV